MLILGCTLPVVLPFHALITKYVSVVTPCWVADVDRGALHEAGDEGGANTQTASATQRLRRG